MKIKVIFITSLIALACRLTANYFNSSADRSIRKELIFAYEQAEQEVPKIKGNIKKEKLKQLQKINSDIIAILTIEGTNINYPVVQTKDNSYYMTHNYKKEKSKDGALFLDKSYDLEKPSTNFLIYGHNNVGSKEMFSDLVKYKKEDFYKKHKTINLVTSKEDACYEIISVFLSRVYYQTEKNVFRYYYFIDAYNKEQFDSFVTSVKNASLYNTGKSAEYGDALITLSTCDYSQPNGRLIVIAKKITD